MAHANPNEPKEPDAPAWKVASASLFCAAAVAFMTVPFALFRVGPDWLQIPLVMTAVVSSAIVLGELLQLMWRQRAGARLARAR